MQSRYGKALIVCAAMFAGVAGAAEPAGTVKSVRGVAHVHRGAAVIPLIIGSTLEPSDRVVTQTDANVGITLKDDTLLAVGPRSNVTLENFAFNSTTHDGRLDVKIASGTLRMITGLIARQAPANVKVVTPNAAIGVRGTDFIVEVPGHG